MPGKANLQHGRDDILLTVQQKFVLVKRGVDLGDFAQRLSHLAIGKHAPCSAMASENEGLRRHGWFVAALHPCPKRTKALAKHVGDRARCPHKDVIALIKAHLQTKEPWMGVGAMGVI